MPLPSAFLQRTVAVSVIAAALLFLLLLQSTAIGNRFPLHSSAGDSRIIIVRTQKDAYQVCKERSFKGAAIVSLGKYFNLQYWAPDYLAKSAPFPIQTFDVRPEFEHALESHNWLFIANRTGMVRKVITVLPSEEYRRRQLDLKSDYGLSPRRFGYEGFHYDLPRSVTTLDRLKAVAGPVIVVADASYFAPDVDPTATAHELAKRLPSVALFIVVSSLDEGELSWDMRRSMALFIRTWQERG